MASFPRCQLETKSEAAIGKIVTCQKKIKQFFKRQKARSIVLRMKWREEIENQIVRGKNKAARTKLSNKFAMIRDETRDSIIK